MFRKTFVVITVVMFALFALAVPAQELHAATCLEGAGKGVVAAGVAGAALLLVDALFFGGLITLTTQVIVGGATLAGTSGCVSALLDKNKK